jgi:hypothetical protein
LIELFKYLTGGFISGVFINDTGVCFFGVCFQTTGLGFCNIGTGFYAICEIFYSSAIK